MILLPPVHLLLQPDPCLVAFALPIPLDLPSEQTTSGKPPVSKVIRFRVTSPLWVGGHLLEDGFFLEPFQDVSFAE